MKKLGILEGLLFVVGDEGLTLENICNIMEITETEAKSLLKSLKEEYENDNHGISINYLGDAFKLTTKAEHKEYYKKLVECPSMDVLSTSSLETLAIIAYNGPLTRAEIDELRGVSTAYTLKRLLSRDLIRVCGKSDLPGRPNLYEVTKVFLDYFGLATINDLPKIEDLKKEEQEDLYKTIFKENE